MSTSTKTVAHPIRHNFLRTHVLSYPLYTSRSSLQLHNLVQRLRSDEQAAECPQKAFRLPKSLFLPVAGLYLKDQHDLKAASELFRSLDITSMLRQAETDAVAANVNNHSEMGTKATVAEAGHRKRVPPLSVSLIGLSQGPRTQPGRPITRVFAVPVDSTNRLHFLSCHIFHRFRSAGLGEPRLESDQGFKYMLLANILSTMQAQKNKKLADENGIKTRKQVKSSYDPRGLIEKYKGVILAENIPLEKLSLYDNRRIAKFEGPRNQFLVDEHYKELDSIALPQEA